MNEEDEMRARKPLRDGALALAAVAAMVAPGLARGGGDREALGAHRLTALDGTTTTLSRYRGEVVVVNFWASWCAPCRNELPVMDRWNAAWAGRGARVVAVSIDNELRNARRFAEAMNLSLVVVHDGPRGLARTLDIPTVPYTLLLDGNGNVVHTVEGSAAEGLAALERRVETMLAARNDPALQEAGMGTPGVER